MKIFKLKIRKFPSNITWINFRQNLCESYTRVLDNVIISSMFSMIETVVINLCTILGFIMTVPLVLSVFLYIYAKDIYKYIQYSLYLLSDN